VIVQRRAVIIGAGPAGLTAAYELLEKTDIKPIIVEATGEIGGISQTVNYKGNRIDIGGHRFFSKSDRVMAWWQNILPLQGKPARDDLALGRKVPLSDQPHAPDPEREDRVMLVRSRLSRILFLRQLFNYPIKLNLDTVKKLGLRRLARVCWAYSKIRLSPRREEKNLEDFFINRFGRELYQLFFKDYTEKVWGAACREIRPEWGAQRVKNLSVSRVLAHAIRSVFLKQQSIAQKELDTSLIGRFLYPKLGPGQMWEEVAKRISAKGGELHLRHKVIGLKQKNDLIVGALAMDRSAGKTRLWSGDYFFSSMPLRDLILGFGEEVDPETRRVAAGLRYRDFISVGILVPRLKMRNESPIPTINGVIPDNWIYIQEPGVRLGRLQVFNNWSPYMVRDPQTVWLGLEYFCNEGDEVWSKPDAEIIRLAIEELLRIGVIEKVSVLDSTLIRMPKAYPAYFGTYDELHVLRKFTDRFANLYPIGRNGMHRYNNQDHSMLTAMRAVETILQGVSHKDPIWQVNAEEDYHENE
jgi:protoporphyrinogen oxidase